MQSVVSCMNAVMHPTYSLNSAAVSSKEADAPLPSDSFSVSNEKVLADSIMKELKSDSSRILDEKTVAFPDNYGRITHLALQLSDYASGSIRKDMLNAYKILFTEMEPDTKFTVVVGSDKDRRDVENMMKQASVPNPERIEFIQPDNLDLTVWARDQMIGMYFPEDDSKTAITNQSMLHNWHADDEQVPQYIAGKYDSIELDRDKRIVTDGGEVVSNRGETFIGGFSLMATAKKLKGLAEKNPDFFKQIQDYAKETMGVNIKLSESENPFSFDLIPKEEGSLLHEQPYFIADNPEYKKQNLKPGEMAEDEMWLKVAHELFEKQFGQKVTVMGMDDPSTPRIEGPANDHLDMGLTPLDENTMCVADPSLAKRAFASMSSERRSEVAQYLSSVAGERYSGSDLLKMESSRYYPNQQQDFDAYAEKLEKSGYRVVRVPYAEPGWGTPNISFNNCLMERFKKEDGSEVKRIFLPVYGIDELDNLAISTYEKEGYEVHPMPLANLATRKGALRCMSQWLDKDQHLAKF